MWFMLLTSIREITVLDSRFAKFEALEKKKQPEVKYFLQVLQ